MHKTMRKAISVFLTLAFIISFIPAVPVLASGDSSGWDVVQSLFVDYNSTDYPAVGQLPWWPVQGWVGNGGGGDNMSIVSGSNVLGSYDGNIPAGETQKRAGNYYVNSAMRGGQANLHAPIESNYRVNMNFDWYPGTPSGTSSTSYGKMAIQDDQIAGFSNSGGTQDNQFINFFTSSHSSNTGLYYVIGNVLDSSAYRVNGSAGATSSVQIGSDYLPVSRMNRIGDSSLNRNTWYNIDLTLDFQSKELTLSVKDAITGETVLDSVTHPFEHQTAETSPYANHPTNENGTPIERTGVPVEYKKQISSFRFVNAVSGWRTQIDNVLIQSLIPFVPPVLTGYSNSNAAKGTFDLEIAPYSLPDDVELEAINIYASTDGGADTLVKTVSSTGVHTINVPRGNATHVITAEAVVSGGTTTNRSNPLTVVHEGVTTPKPGVVSDVSFTVVNGQIDLSWAPVADADEYIIYRAFFERSAYEVIGTVNGATSFSDMHPKLTNTASTYYKIEAIGDGGSGGLSGTFASTKSGYQLQPRDDGKKDRALTAVNLAGDKGAEVLVSATGPDGEELTSGVYLSWRWFEADETYNTTFTLYKNGSVLASGLTVTNLVDPDGGEYDIYRIEGSSDTAQNVTAADIRVWNNFYQELQLYMPPMETMNNGKKISHTANDIIVADLTGSGTLDMIVKWYPTNAVDASIGGQTGTTYFDAYEVDWNTGETVMLWRVALGTNVRSSAHFAQFGAADFRGIGSADMMATVSTSTRTYRSMDGTDQSLVLSDTRVGDGSVGTIPTGTASGITHIAAFDGKTGEIISSIAIPTAVNNGSRWNGCVAYLRGHDQNPAFVTGGQYGNIKISEWRFNDDGTELVQGWTYTGSGQANHNMFGVDLHGPDAEGKRYDSIVMGAAVITSNAARDGLVLLSSNGTHGDAMHVSNWIYDENNLNENGYPRQYQLEVQENPGTGSGRLSVFTRDLLSNSILAGWNAYPNHDVGRGVAGDVDPTSKNAEMWGANGPLSTVNGNWNLRTGGLYGMENYGVVYASESNGSTWGNLTQLSEVSPSMNFTLFWDGDLLTELQDHEFNEQVGYVPVNTNITKWDYVNNREIFLFLSDEVYTINGTKGNPNLQGDILGDWREEVIFRDAKDASKVRLYMTTIQTDYVLPHLMEDHNYNMGIQYQHSTYNQPPNTSYLPSAQAVTPRELDYSTMTADAGVRVSYTAANDGQYGLEITGHQLWRKDGDAGTFDLTPSGTLSDSTKRQLEAAGYIFVAEVIGDEILRDETAIVGQQYSFVVVGVAGDKLSYLGHPFTVTLEDRSADVTSISVDPATATLTELGATAQLTATVLPENAQNKNVVWSSSNESIATVDNSGLVTAVSNGTATITAASVSGGIKATGKVTVAIPTFAVTFMMDEDEVYVVRNAYQNIAMGDNMVPNPYKAGYRFAGWFDSADGGTEFTADTVVTGDMTVYARFVEQATAQAGNWWGINFQADTQANPAGWTAIAGRTVTSGTGGLIENPTNGTTATNGEGNPTSGFTAGPGAAVPFTASGTTNSRNRASGAVYTGIPDEGLIGTDPNGATVTIPKTASASWISGVNFTIDLPNGAYNVVVVHGGQGDIPRGGLVFNDEPADMEVQINSAGATAMASRDLENSAASAMITRYYYNVIVKDGKLNVYPVGGNESMNNILITAWAIHTPIEEAIAEVGKLNQADYSMNSWANLQAAVAAAQAAMTKGGSNSNTAYSQSEIDAFAEAIYNAIEALDGGGDGKTLSVDYSGFTQLVSGNSAGIPVTVSAVNPDGLKIFAGLFVDDVLTGEAVEVIGGSAYISAPKFTTASDNVYLKAWFEGEEASAVSKAIPVKQLPANIWKAEVLSVADGKTTILFGDDIALIATASVTINGIHITDFSAQGTTLTIDAAAEAGDVIVMKGVKYTNLFPSYSFTFTVKAE